MDVCVCLSGADGRVVEGRATLFQHHREVSRADGPPMDVVCCCIHVVSSRKRRRERVGVGSREKYPGAPPHHRKNEKKPADRKRLTRQIAPAQFIKNCVKAHRPASSLTASTASGKAPKST
ncbi:hypothetical protein GEV33_001125 [Tenebrio molitor]|uniref:Uncharacterized protein n=1 Tax=Tenebrio molitor TaxID=7067 RepID=A0A8J6HXQ8_TENMO|nr:hypothetical protein GEV33_001125 [Tenebrio molitor]